MTKTNANHSIVAVISGPVSINIQEDRMMNENVISNSLADVTPETARFLEKTLSYLDEHWVQKYVVPAVYQPWLREEARKSPSNIMVELDLSALLAVFARNWQALSGDEGHDYARLNCINQMRTIRNKFAHRGSRPPSPREMVRYMDTILCYLDLIAADESLIQRAKMHYEAAVLQLAATFLKRKVA